MYNFIILKSVHLDKVRQKQCFTNWRTNGQRPFYESQKMSKYNGERKQIHSQTHYCPNLFFYPTALVHIDGATLKNNHFRRSPIHPFPLSQQWFHLHSFGPNITIYLSPFLSCSFISILHID